jgi:hypothetical protein
MSENARLSKMLYEAREAAEMFADVVKAQSGREDAWLRRVIADIDAYRTEHGWSLDGFGGEP